MRKVMVFLGFLFFLVSPAYAGIPVESTDYTGSRRTPKGSGIDSTGGYLDENGGFKIEWNISFDGTYWNYSYTLTNEDGTTVSPDVSHWILEISPEVDFENIGDYIFDANATVVTPPANNDYKWEADDNFPYTTSAGANAGNPNLGADLTGIKFDTDSGSVSGV